MSNNAPSVVFFTVTRSKDYNYLLGSIEHHAKMGRHVVLDTTMPGENPKQFRNLPPSVTWIHEPLYGSGWKEFRFVAASQRALNAAMDMKPDVLIWLDSDEFFSESIISEVIPHALYSIVDTISIHWKKDGHPYMFGESEWHTKIWPRWVNLRVGLNLAWPVHKDYNGNPEHHAILHVNPSSSKMRVLGPYRHHLHYAIGPNRDDEDTARTTIQGWAEGGKRLPDVDWPAKMDLWRSKGIEPIESFL